MVMRKYAPDRAEMVKATLPTLHDEEAVVRQWGSGFNRWCILEGNTEDLKRPSDVLPDYARYHDLLAIEYLYYTHIGEWQNAQRIYALELTQYDGEFITDLATRVGYVYYPPPDYWEIKALPEGHTMYKLALLAICSIHHARFDIAKRCLGKIAEFQVGNQKSKLYKEGPVEEIGGVKTEWWNPEWGAKPDHLLTLANTETTSLAILAQDLYNSKTYVRDKLLPSMSVTVIGISALYGFSRLALTLIKRRR